MSLRRALPRFPRLFVFLMIKQALISVSDKSGIVDFAKALSDLGVEILSTGGTAKLLADAGLLRHRSRRLHGLPGNARRARQDAASEGARRHARAPRPAGTHGSARGARHSDHRPAGREPVPVRADRAKEECSLEDAIENIDIGGPAMVRSAAKNSRRDGGGRSVALRGRARGDARDGAVVDTTRFALAITVFAHTAQLRRRDQRLPLVARSPTDSARAQFPAQFNGPSTRCRTCATAKTRTRAPRSIATCRRRPARSANYNQLQGKELSYNNIADADAAWECVKTLRRAGLRDRQAREPVRRGARRRSARSLRARRSRPIRPRRSAASSRSTAKWMERRRKRWPSSSSKC